MTIKIAKVTGMAEKTSQAGTQYTQFQTSIGNLNVFDDDKIKGLQSCVGSYGVIDVVLRGKYLNVNNVPYKASQEQLDTYDWEDDRQTQAPVFTGNQGAEVKPTAERIDVPDMVVKNPLTQRIIMELVDERARNWVEVGKAGERYKIYFHKQEDLKAQIRETAITIRSALYQDMDGQEPEATKEDG